MNILHTQIKKGSLSQILHIPIEDLANPGKGKTGLLYNTTYLHAQYIRQGAAASVAISLVTATGGTWVSGGFVEADATYMKGIYELHIPNACLASGADRVTLLVCFDNDTVIIPTTIIIDLIDTSVKGAVATDASNDEVTFKTTLTALATDYVLNQWVRFLTGNLAGQIQKATHNDGAGGYITVSAPFTGIPADGDQFELING